MEDDDLAPSTVAHVRWQRARALCPGAFADMADPARQISAHLGIAGSLTPPATQRVLSPGDDTLREERLLVGTHDDQLLYAHIVNIVHKTSITGSRAQVPWLCNRRARAGGAEAEGEEGEEVGRHGAADRDTVPVIPVAAVAQSCLGIMTQTDASRFAMRFRAPFRSKYKLSTTEPSLRETAAMSEWYAERTRTVMRVLVARACGLDGAVEVRAHCCLNIVAVVFLPYEVNLARLLALHSDVFKRPVPRNAPVVNTVAAATATATTPAATHTKPTFDGLVGKHVHLPKRRVLVFREGAVICVGSKTRAEVVAAYTCIIALIRDAAMTS